MGMNVLKVLDWSLYTHTHNHTHRHSPLTRSSYSQILLCYTLKSRSLARKHQVHVIHWKRHFSSCDIPKVKASSHPDPLSRTTFTAVSCQVLPPGWIRRWHMKLFHCQMHLLLGKYSLSLSSSISNAVQVFSFKTFQASKSGCWIGSSSWKNSPRGLRNFLSHFGYRGSGINI